VGEVDRAVRVSPALRRVMLLLVAVSKYNKEWDWRGRLEHRVHK